MFKTGTKLFIEQGGNGWAKITGYTCVVLDRQEVIEGVHEGLFVEGLGVSDADFFVEVLDCIYMDDEGEDSDSEEDERVIEYDSNSVWGISLNSERAKVIQKN